MIFSNTLKRVFFIIFITQRFLYCQELPPIIKYSQNDYLAGIQNWMISQDSNHYLFFANNEGLLEFNGSNWTLYPTPNQTIMRSVKVVGNKIYTGCYMEFGYWKREKDGLLKYYSLSNKIKNKLIDDEQFWNIIEYEQWVVFQSLNRIYIYNTLNSDFKIITPKNGVLKSFKTNNSLYFQSENVGLFEIERGNAKLLSDNEIVKNNRIVNVFETNNGLLIQTQSNGFYKFSEKK